MERNKIEVFCDDCKFLNWDGDDDKCKTLSNTIIKKNWRKKYKDYRDTPSDLNATNECKFFKPKRYKRKKYRNIER